MAGSSTHVVVNPAAAGGRTAKRWPGILNELTSKLGPVTYTFTDGPGDGVNKSRAALEDGAGLLIVVGGDGTFSECINGCFKSGKPLNPELDFALVTSGTGCDIRRAHNWPDAKNYSDMIDKIAASTTHGVDLGHVLMTDRSGNPSERHFVNSASFGVGGAVSNAVNTSRIAKKFGGTATFLFHALREAFRFQNQKVRIVVDDVLDEEFDIILAVAALGPYFGGGLKIAPEADLTDGLFEVLVGHDITKSQIPRLISQIYKGKHVEDPKVKTLKGRRIVAAPVNPSEKVWLEIDGESPGTLKAEFKILPGALRLRG